MKCHHPDVFCCAILNSLPMGFYAPAQLVRDARNHGVDMRWVDVNRSEWDCTLEKRDDGRCAVRLGFRMVRGVKEEDVKRLVATRAHRPFGSIDELWNRVGIGAGGLRRLAAADAFRSLGLSRRQAIWEIGRLRESQLALFAAADMRTGAPLPEISEPPVPLDLMTLGSEVVEDYRSIGLSLRPHPLAFLRRDLDRLGSLRCADLYTGRNGRTVTVSGLVLVRQKPGSAKGVMFITLEDETDVANLVVWPAVFERQRRLILTAGMIAARGRVQRQGDVVHLVVEHLTDLSHLLRQVGDRDEPLPLQAGRGDEARHGGGPDQRETESLGRRPRDIYIPDLHIGSGIKVQTRDFR
jgi:error-prone DNA polymerase